MLLIGAKHHHGFAKDVMEEASACLHRLRCAHEFGICNVVVKGNCLQLIQKLTFRSSHDNLVDFCFIKDFIVFLVNFDFYS